jgi:drug/metabolite transporter (DMT)-like permease
MVAAFLPWSLYTTFGIAARFWWWRAPRGSPATITGTEYGEGWVVVALAAVAFGLTLVRHKLAGVGLIILGAAIALVVIDTATGAQGFRPALGFYLTVLAGLAMALSPAFAWLRAKRSESR